MKHLDHYLEQAIQNIKDDRSITKELLDDVVRFLAKDEKRHTEVGSIAAKYVETLQRSNEQLVKISNIIQCQLQPFSHQVLVDSQLLFSALLLVV